MGVRVTSTYICDRCAAEWQPGHELQTRGKEGELTVTWSGHFSAIAYNGDAGGANLSGKALLCLACQDAFLAFIKPK
jgi:hypothetical protein